MVNAIALMEHMEEGVMSANLENGIFPPVMYVKPMVMQPPVMQKLERRLLVVNSQLETIVKSVRMVIMESQLWKRIFNAELVLAPVPYFLDILLPIDVFWIPTPENLFVNAKTCTLATDVMNVTTIFLAIQKW
jgi:hypothetical protein